MASLSISSGNTDAESLASPMATLLGPIVRPSLTPEQAALRDEIACYFREKFKDEPLALEFLSDSTVTRYLWAHQFLKEKVMKNLEDTVIWRRSYIKPDLHCTLCARDSRSHCFVRVGCDRYNRPIIYACPARAYNSDGAESMRHLVAEMEHAFRDPAAADNWVWVGDMRGFSVFGSGFSVSLAKEFVSIFTAHYPERLGVMLIVDPPSLVDWTYSAVKPFMDPVTVRKNMIVKPKEIKDVVDAIASSEEQARWLMHALTSEPKAGTLAPLPADAPTPVHIAISSTPTQYYSPSSPEVKEEKAVGTPGPVTVAAAVMS